MGAILDALFGPTGPGTEAVRQQGLGATMFQASQANMRGNGTGSNHRSGFIGLFDVPESGSRSDAQLLTDDAANQMGYEVWY